MLTVAITLTFDAVRSVSFITEIRPQELFFTISNEQLESLLGNGNCAMRFSDEISSGANRDAHIPPKYS